MDHKTKSVETNCRNRLKALERSKFRARFKLDSDDLVYIGQIELPRLKGHAYDFIRKRLAPAQPKNDGKQTPFKGHPVFKAQHATATCCRGCLQKWYGIKKGRGLTNLEIDMIVDTIFTWIGKEMSVATYESD